MGKYKEILKDIYRNYKYPMFMSLFITSMILIFLSSDDIFWYTVALSIAVSPIILIIGYFIYRLNND